MLKTIKGFIFGLLAATGIFSILINIGFYADVEDECKLSKLLHEYLNEEE